MRVCIYEDSGTSCLEPITLTRPAFALWCGAQRLFERHMRQFAASEVGFWMRSSLAELWRLEQPNRPINDTDWLRDQSTVWINGRWLPGPAETINAASPQVGMVDGRIAYAVLPHGDAPSAEEFDGWLLGWKDRLPMHTVSGTVLEYLWEFVDANPKALKQDAAWFEAEHGIRPLPQVSILGPVEWLLVGDDAVVEPFVFADTRGGPIMIERGAIVHSFSRLEGPCYVGKGSWIVGAKLRAGSTIGPTCKIGGEVEATIVQGFSNKYHDGFLGHSYLGEWVNLAAATQTSDLRNDYETIRVNVNGQRVSSGRTKIGSYIGDHTKTGLSALLNTGSTIGAFASLLPSGSLLPTVIPSFCQVQAGQLQELWDLRKVFTTAARVMERRGQTLTETHKNFYYDLFEVAADSRKKAMQAGEVRKLRRSV